MARKSSFFRVERSACGHTVWCSSKGGYVSSTKRREGLPGRLNGLAWPRVLHMAEAPPHLPTHLVLSRSIMRPSTLCKRLHIQTLPLSSGRHLSSCSSLRRSFQGKREPIDFHAYPTMLITY
jgi:hypothetical protein